MPETALGLFPDIGASYFLSRLPGYFGNIKINLLNIFCPTYHLPWHILVSKPNTNYTDNIRWNKNTYICVHTRRRRIIVERDKGKAIIRPKL